MARAGFFKRFARAHVAIAIVAVFTAAWMIAGSATADRRAIHNFGDSVAADRQQSWATYPEFGGSRLNARGAGPTSYLKFAPLPQDGAGALNAAAQLSPYTETAWAGGGPASEVGFVMQTGIQAHIIADTRAPPWTTRAAALFGQRPEDFSMGAGFVFAAIALGALSALSAFGIFSIKRR